jgi:hypothetical protein
MSVCLVDDPWGSRILTEEARTSALLFSVHVGLAYFEVTHHMNQHNSYSLRTRLHVSARIVSHYQAGAPVSLFLCFRPKHVVLFLMYLCCVEYLYLGVFPSPGLLCSVKWFVTDVSKLPVGSNFNSQTVQEDYFTVEVLRWVDLKSPKTLKTFVKSKCSQNLNLWQLFVCSIWREGLIHVCVSRCHKGVWGRRGIDPFILNLSIIWRWVVSLMTWPPYSRRRSIRYTLDWRLYGLQNRSGQFRERKLPYSCRESKEGL